eukprot:343968_1
MSAHSNCQASSIRSINNQQHQNMNETKHYIVFGYVKYVGLNINIPNEIILVILKYYGNDNTFIYVVGRNDFCQMGLITSRKYMARNGNVHTLTLQQSLNKHNIQHIYGGSLYSIYSDRDHKNIWSAGDNSYDQCCTGNINNGFINKLTKIQLFNDKEILIKNIFTGSASNTTFWMDKNNKIYGSGMNYCHSLGLGDDVNHKFGVVPIPKLKNIIDIQPASRYTLALDRNGNVYSTGKGSYGVHGEGHGHGANKEIKQFTKINGFNNEQIIKIKASMHSLFLSSSGNVWSCGLNNCGQLGLGHEKNISTPTLIKYFVENKIKVIDIASGSHHSLCIDSKNTIYSWGDNGVGQGGLGSKEIALIPKIIETLKNEHIVTIKCGSTHSYAMSRSSNHYLWGNNDHHQCLGRGECIFSPNLINDIIYKKTKSIIRNIFLGYENTKLMVVNYENDKN